MTPAARGAHAVLPATNGGDPAAELGRLLERVPPDAVAAQTQVCALASRLVGSGVVVRATRDAVELHRDPAVPVPSETAALLRRAEVWLTLAAERDAARTGALAEAAET